MRLSKAQKETPDVDAQLVRAVARGEADALDEFIHRNGPWVRGVIFAVSRRLDMVDDVQQQVWLSAWRRAGTLEDPGCWRSWIYRLTCRAAIDAGRAAGRRSKLLNRLRYRPAVRDMAEDQGHRKIELAEAHQRALLAVGKLPETYRQAFVLRHLADFSYLQIAETMDIPANSVGSLLLRARRLLREELGEETKP